jgi:general secretion pathway protein D
MRLIKNYLKIMMLLMLFWQHGFASNSYKIIIGTYSSENNAQHALEQSKKKLQNQEKFATLKEKNKFNFVISKDNKFFVVSLRSFSDKKALRETLDEVKKQYPSAFFNKNIDQATLIPQKEVKTQQTDKKTQNKEKAKEQPKKEEKKKEEKKQEKVQEQKAKEIKTQKIETKPLEKKQRKPKPRKNTRKKVNVNFVDLEINDFVKLISKITNKNILINYKINGNVNFVSTTPIYEDELMGILISVLESKGYTLVQNGSIYEIIRSTEAAKHNVRVVSSDKRLYGSVMTTQSIKIKSENADIIAAKVRYLLSKTAKLVTMKESNVILITDYPRNIETIKKVIKNIETDNNNIVKIVPIKNAEVKKLQKHLVSISKSIFNEKVASQKVKIILDDNTNGLIIVGEKNNVLQLEKLIKKLDVESHINKSVKIFNLKNSDVKSVLTSLNDIISKQKYSDPALKPNVSAGVEINAIIAVGEPIVLKGIKLIIDELDKEKYQVYIQARIIEINKNNSEALGVKYGFAGGDVSASGLYAMSANFGDKGLTESAISAVKSYLGGIGLVEKSAFALGATIEFLQTKGASRSISNPSILCVNNKQSSIYVGKTISVSSGQTAVSGSTTTSYKREDVGLTLKIKPRVSSADKVTLDVETILENILDDGSNNATGQPVTSKQEVKTQAILRHGESIIIGGLVKNYKIHSISKVPLLGDIPLIGEYLFSSQSEKVEEDNLIVILTPYIIDKSNELSKLQKQLGVLTDIQKKYNVQIFQKIKSNQKKEQ